MLTKLLAIFFCATAICCPQMLSSQAKGAARAQIVMLSTDGGCAAGIVVGSDAKRVYIATAAHVIPDLSARPLPPVAVHLDGNIHRNGVFLETFDPPGQGDLAVVAIPRDVAVDTFLGGLDFALLSPDSSIPQDSRVYSIGCSGGVRWSTGSDETFRAGGANLVFDSAIIEGQSGGGLFDSGWELIGMPFLADGSRAQAHPIGDVLQRVRAWKWPIALKERAAGNRLADSETVAQEARAVTLVEQAQSLLSRPPSDSSVIAAYAMVASRLATPRQTRVVSQAWNAMQRVGFVRTVAGYSFSSDSKDYSDDPFHGERVTFPTVAADSAVSLRSNGATVVWDDKGEKPRFQIQQPAAGISVGPDGAIAIFGKDNNLTLWSAENGRRLETFTSPTPVVSAAFNEDGRWLAIEGSNHTLSIWNRAGTQVAARFVSPGGPNRLKVCGDGALVGMTGKDGGLKIYSREKAGVVAQLRADSNFQDFAFVPGCAQVVIADRAGGVRIASTKDGSEIAKISTGGPFAFVTLSSDGTSIVTVPKLGREYDPFTVRILSLIDQREVSWLDESGRGFDKIEFTADGKGFLLSTHTQSGGGSLGFADLYALDLSGREDQVKFASGKITAIAFDDAGSQIEVATAGKGNEGVSGSNRSSNCEDSCGAIISSNGKWKLLADDDGFGLVNLSTGKNIGFSSSLFYDGNFDRPSAMAISPDGATVAVAVSHAIGIFEISDLTAKDKDLTPREKMDLTLRVKISGDATSLAFSPDGQLLVVGLIDGVVHVVRSPGGEDLAVANAGSAITAVAITNDGRFAAADAWGRARVWNASIDSMRKRLCSAPGSNLSQEGWKANLYLNVQPPQLTCENWAGY